MTRTTARFTPAAIGSVLALAASACAREPAAEPTERVEIDAFSYDYRPASFRVSPGTIRFVVSNTEPAQVHGFEVEGHGMEEEIERIDPGSTDSLDVAFEEPGEYEIYCPVEDHAGRGMVARLTVEEAATP
jgi:plastocyanin